VEELIYTSATALARAIRAKEVSSEEVVNAYLQRIDEVNPKLNAVVQVTADTARVQAREADAALARGDIKGPLHGVPITIKDSFETTGVISTGGTKGRASFVPKQDASVVARMRAAGAILLGKTNLPELALLPETNNLVYGQTNNPYDLSRTPGGSSGGEGAIIAAGGSPLGIGSDSGGSIRIPAHFCGIAGIKPTTGRVPTTGQFPPRSSGRQETLWGVGPLARFVEDLMLALPIISGVDWRDPVVVPMPLGDPRAVAIKNLRVAFYTDYGEVLPTLETAEAVRTTAKALSDAGMVVEEAQPEVIEQSASIWFRLVAGDGGTWCQELLKAVGTTETHPFLQRVLELMAPHAMSTTEFCAVLIELDAFRSKMLSFMENYDLIICPVVACPALPHGTVADNAAFFHYPMTDNLTGWPVAVVRGGTSPEGLPIGVQIVARPWREDVALAAAQCIETALGGWQRPPL